MFLIKLFVRIILFIFKDVGILNEGFSFSVCKGKIVFVIIDNVRYN